MSNPTQARATEPSKADRWADRWGKRFVFSLVLVGFVFVPWAFWSVGKITYVFWKHGVEKEAYVVESDHQDYAYRGGTTYYYVIEIDGHQSTQSFRMRLPVGKHISVLVLPAHPDKICLGSRESSLFQIYVYAIGGRFYAVLTLGAFALLAVLGPGSLRQLWQKRRVLFQY